ncbi:hypothetical protein EDD22DRAFT_959001 [Suillus occidentalis]|nr:hypothetical protein EDD22DRAFT_959001 [Suillus occidentalis]
MSLLAESSYLDSNRNPESSYADSDNGHPARDVTESPDVQESSQDEYMGTPPRHRTSTIYSTPTNRSEPKSSISARTRLELAKFCKSFYDWDKPLCLVTQKDSAAMLQISHVVQRSSKKNDLTLYEYCLGLDYRHFHVDSRRNLLYLSSEIHSSFDANEWILLPNVSTLDEVKGHIAAVIESRNGPTPNIVSSYQLKWTLKSRTTYTFVTLGCKETFFRARDISLHHYPYSDLPLLESHVSPPLAVINAGPKCKREDVESIVLRRYSPKTKEYEDLERRLTLLCDIWSLIVDAKDAATAWGKSEGGQSEGMGKRKRDESEASQTSGRSTRSKTRAQQGGERKRKRTPNSSGATLTEYALSHLEKRQKGEKWEKRIQRWVVESTRASSLDPNLPLEVPPGIASV